MARRTNLRVFAGCSLLGFGLPDITAVVITIAKITSAVPRWAVMIVGGSFHKTVRPPSTICTTRKHGASNAGIRTAFSFRAQIRELIATAMMRILTMEAV